jgi:hypothetical protein
VSQESRRPTADPSRSEFQVGLEYDFDRQLVFDGIQPLCGSQHGSFSSRPWNSLEDYLLAAAAFADFRKSSCLRTRNDLDLFADHMKIHHAKNLNGSPIPKEPLSVLKLAHRTFLRALVRGEEGLAPYSGGPRKDLCLRINQALKAFPDGKHLETSVDDLKNAARPKSTYATGTLPRTRQVEAFFARMGAAFPGFTGEMLYAPSPRWEYAGKKTHPTYRRKTAILLRYLLFINPL